MAVPVVGRDAFICFRHNGNMVPYGCAINMEINFTMETKETKTIGDGVWGRSRGQKLGFTISLDGIIRYLPTTAPAAFDLLEYYRNMTDIEFMIIFRAIDYGTFVSEGERVIEGIALPTNVTLSAGPEGHANASFELQGNGEPDIRDAVIPCSSRITVASYLGEIANILGNIRITTVVTVTPITRFDYSVDGGGIQTEFTDGSLPHIFSASVTGANGSSHSIEIWPVCENGYNGESIVVDFTKHN